MSTPRWYVIQTKPREEFRCMDELARQGIEVFCPMLKEYRWRRRQYEIVPLFSNYILGHFPFSEKYYTIKWMRGVNRIVSFGDRPSPLDDSVVEFLRDRLDSNGVIEGSAGLNEGDPVQFKDGPLEGLLGTILRINSASGRVMVLMDLLNYQAKVEVETHLLKAV